MQNTDGLYDSVNNETRQIVKEEMKAAFYTLNDWREAEREKIRKEIFSQFEQPTPAIPCVRNPDFACKGICNEKCAFQKNPA